MSHWHSAQSQLKLFAEIKAILSLFEKRKRKMGSRPQTFLSKFVGEEGEGVDTSLEIFKLLLTFFRSKVHL